MRDELGCMPQEIYGTAEGRINIVPLDADDETILGSSGVPVSPEDEIKVVDDDGAEVPDGEPSELLTRGPYTIRGCYDNAAKNAEAFTADGFYRMGDIVRKRGRVVYTEGRRKDLMNRGGIRRPRPAIATSSAFTCTANGSFQSLRSMVRCRSGSERGLDVVLYGRVNRHGAPEGGCSLVPAAPGSGAPATPSG